jgi:hypothetical protein
MIDLANERRKAEAAGEKYYAIGIPCKSMGHLRGRMVSTGKCRECRDMRREEARKRYKEKIAKLGAKEEMVTLPKGIIPGARVYISGKRVL